MSKNILLYSIMIILIALVGFFQSWNVALLILNMCIISAVMSLGVNIQYGYAGLFNLGIMGFVALGGLATVIISAPPVYEAWSAGGVRVISALFFGALVAALSNLLFAWLAISPTSINFLIAVITADNISSGFAGAAFVIYLSGLTSIKFTATQYALFSSIMLFLPKLIAGYAGSWVDIMGYAYFFSFTAFLGIPVLILIIWIGKVAPIRN